MQAPGGNGRARREGRIATGSVFVVDNAKRDLVTTLDGWRAGAETLLDDVKNPDSFF